MGLLTASTEKMGAARRDLAAGKLQLVVGTHALLQEKVRFRRLGLAIVDEQHRFGVAQRQALVFKGSRPDLLVMTATPIPRSLCLTLYGDLALSVIDELPPGRGEVRTRLVPQDARDETYAWLHQRLREGGQAYVVYPKIDPGSEKSGTALLGEGNFKLMTITHVDTSTGVGVDVERLAALGREHGVLVVVDGVCSVGGEELCAEEWGVDLVLTASQKAIGVPPGLALVVAGPRAMDAFRTRRTTVGNYYADWTQWLPIMDAYQDRQASYFGTPPVNLIWALNVSLARF
jgi:hypothetical protein